jgi:glycosyltransferase involved in cell wall biosynthesis
MDWLIISARHHPGQGGIGTYITHFCAATSAGGWRVRLMTRPGPHHPSAHRVYEVTTPDDPPEFAGRIRRLRRIERIRPYRYGLWALAVAERLLTIDDRPDVIEFVDCQAEGYVALRSRRVRRRFAGVPMIVHAHGPMFIQESLNHADMRCFGRALYHRWERAALGAADGVIAGSDLMARCLGRSDAAVIPCPLEIAPIKTAPAPMRTTARRITLVGSVQPSKGVRDWADSLNIVLRAAPGVCAELIGPDTMTAPDGSSMIRFVRNCIEPELQSRFSWRGELDHKEVITAIESAAIVVIPGHFESFSYVGAEAILRGRPVILSDQTGLAQWMDGVTTVPAGDPAALARAQLRILEHYPEAQAAGAVLRDRLMRICAPAHVLQRRQAFAQSITASSPPSPAEGHDAIHRMRRFLAAVEEAERRERPAARNCAFHTRQVAHARHVMGAIQ